MSQTMFGLSTTPAPPGTGEAGPPAGGRAVGSVQEADSVPAGWPGAQSGPPGQESEAGARPAMEVGGIPRSEGSQGQRRRGGVISTG
ncbi:MAG: hypothetical protein QN120_05300 [Armatimonadota bacterium]|nr:hypothetical protein [Armatimonadota bacterium]